LRSSAFDIFAGWCSVVAGIFGFLYSLSFVIIQRNSPEIGAILSSFFLIIVGFFTTGTLTAIYSRLRGRSPEFALWAYLLGVVGSLGSAIHGAYDLANAIHPSAAVAAQAAANIPSQIDPRGFLTFLIYAVALLTFSILIVTSKRYPHTLGILGIVTASVFMLLYLARLIILDPTNLIVLILAVLSGFILAPVWNIWFGLALWRGVTK
jgi:hypothetical protein